MEKIEGGVNTPGQANLHGFHCRAAHSRNVLESAAEFNSGSTNKIADRRASRRGGLGVGGDV